VRRRRVTALNDGDHGAAVRAGLADARPKRRSNPRAISLKHPALPTQAVARAGCLPHSARRNAARPAQTPTPSPPGRRSSCRRSRLARGDRQISLRRRRVTGVNDGDQGAAVRADWRDARRKRRRADSRRPANASRPAQTTAAHPLPPPGRRSSSRRPRPGPPARARRPLIGAQRRSRGSRGPVLGCRSSKI
jgi:hypothetical protein